VTLVQSAYRLLAQASVARVADLAEVIGKPTKTCNLDEAIAENDTLNHLYDLALI
jgi:hypothetical protein